MHSLQGTLGDSVLGSHSTKKRPLQHQYQTKWLPEQSVAPGTYRWFKRDEGSPHEEGWTIPDVSASNRSKPTENKRRTDWWETLRPLLSEKGEERQRTEKGPDWHMTFTQHILLACIRSSHMIDHLMGHWNLTLAWACDVMSAHVCLKNSGSEDSIERCGLERV